MNQATPSATSAYLSDGELGPEQAIMTRVELDLTQLVRAYVAQYLKLKEIGGGLDYSKVTFNLRRIMANLNLALVDILKTYHSHDHDLSVICDDYSDNRVYVEAIVSYKENKVYIPQTKKWWQRTKPDPIIQIETVPVIRTVLSFRMDIAGKGETIEVIGQAIDPHLAEAVLILDALKLAAENFFTSHQQSFLVRTKVYQK